MENLKHYWRHLCLYVFVHISLEISKMCVCFILMGQNHTMVVTVYELLSIETVFELRILRCFTLENVIRIPLSGFS